MRNEFDDILYHGWKDKAKERAYNKWYYETHKDKWNSDYYKQQRDKHLQDANDRYKGMYVMGHRFYSKTGKASVRKEWDERARLADIDKRFAANMDKKYRYALKREKMDRALAPAKKFASNWKSGASSLKRGSTKALHSAIDNWKSGSKELKNTAKRGANYLTNLFNR